MSRSLLSSLNESECDCNKCRNMCTVPCIPTPEEAETLISAGYGDRLMWRIIYIESERVDVTVLCPASKGDEGKEASCCFISSCTFQSAKGLCELHNLGLKPKEGRIVDHNTGNEKGKKIHEKVVILWKSDYAQDLVKKWKDEREREKKERLI